MKKLLEEMEQAKAANDKLVSALREHLKSLFDEVALQYKASFDRFVARALHLCPNDDLSELGMFMVVKDGQLVEEELEDEAEGLESGSNVAAPSRQVCMVRWRLNIRSLDPKEWPYELMQLTSI